MVRTCTVGVAPAPAVPPEGTLTVAVATFGNERWLPHRYVGAEDIVLKPMLENLLSRDSKTGAMIPMLAARYAPHAGSSYCISLPWNVLFSDSILWICHVLPASSVRAPMRQCFL